jgi:hypothetical protein
METRVLTELSGVRMPAGGKKFLFSKTSRRILGPTQHPIQWVPWVKGQGRDADHSPLSSAEGKNGWSYTSAPPPCHNGVEKGNLIFLFTCRTARNMLNVECAQSVRASWTEPVPKIQNTEQVPWKQIGSSETQQSITRAHLHKHI